MAKKDDTPKNSSSVIDEIEQQLEQAIAKKREDVEKTLEEKIRKERDEARKRIEELTREAEEEKKTLGNFKSLLAEFETNKNELKVQIKEHVEKAIQFQTEIESLTGKTLEELKKVRELNQRLEELQQDAGEKVSALRRDLEERYGIVTEVPEGEEPDETEINLELELTKLKKIKELLNTSGHVEEVSREVEPQEPEKGEGEEVVEPGGEPHPEEEKMEGGEAETVEPEGAARPEEPEVKQEAEQEKTAEEPPSEELPEAVAQPEGEGEASFQVAFEKLEQFRKGGTNENEAEVSYFENKNRIVLDGEYLVSTLNNCFEEAKRLYIKLSQTESPKDQFFIKQEIIKQQEYLRKVMLRGIRLGQRDNCSLPDYTKEVLNLDVLKEVLERVSMQNWSNQDDFAAFDKFAKELKDSFYAKITPPVAYLQSVLRELEIF
jgi:hypothetical protein